MSLYRLFVNNTNPRSLNYKLRQKRLQLFLSQIRNCKRPVSILDIGGRPHYWESLFFTIEGINRDDFIITITNIDESHVSDSDENESYYRLMVADARDMNNFTNNEFDVVHSNSVIEHVGNLDDQLQMASEVRRVGKQHFLQTPNYYFPVEPHFRALFFHWLPKYVRVKLVQWRKMGHLPKASDSASACKIVDSVQLLKLDQLERLFPQSFIHNEHFMGLNKSFIVVGSSY